VFHLWVNPLFVHILAGQKSFYLISRCIRSWLLKVAWQLHFPVCVDEVIVELLEHVDLSWRPQVQVDRLDLGNVRAETSVLT